MTLLVATSVWVLLSSSTERSRDWTYGLTSLSEKTQRSNHLQMLEQRQHLLLNYFKNLSVGPAGNRTQASRTVNWHLTRLTRRRSVYEVLKNGSLFSPRQENIPSQVSSQQKLILIYRRHKYGKLSHF